MKIICIRSGLAVTAVSQTSDQSTKEAVSQVFLLLTPHSHYYKHCNSLHFTLWEDNF